MGAHGVTIYSSGPDEADVAATEPTVGVSRVVKSTDSIAAGPLGDFQALVAGYQTAIYRAAYRLAGNRDDAEDLVQESLLEAFQAFDRFRVGSRFDHWVYRIMTRNYIDKFRRRRRVSILSLDEMTDERELVELADSSGDPQEVIEQNVWSEPVQKALDKLAPEFRAVVVLCDIQGMSYEDAGKALGCPVGTVRSRLHRARYQLRRSLGSEPSGARE